MARLLDRAFDNPATSGGLMVMTLTAIAIVSNAMFLQPSRHPGPLFSTRPLPTAVHAASQGLTTHAILKAPLPSPRPATNTAGRAPAAEAETKLVTEVQRELARLGLYTGAIDGIAGTRTRAAIATYQTAAGHAVTGAPSAELLAVIEDPVAIATAPEVKPTAPAKPVTAAPPAATEARFYRRVQAALNEIGYGPIAIDGRAGSRTATAIRRFELDHGLPISGEIDDRLIERLVSIGAMSAT